MKRQKTNLDEEPVIFGLENYFISGLGIFLTFYIFISNYAKFSFKDNEKVFQSKLREEMKDKLKIVSFLNLKIVKG